MMGAVKHEPRREAEATNDPGCPQCLAGPPRVLPRRLRRAGFTLIELLIVLVVIGVLAAIAIPNLLGALQRARQKRTVSDMRSVGSALEAYAIDADEYPLQAAPDPVAAIASSLTPTFIVSLPDLDAWRTPLTYEGTEKEYTLVSFGRDRQPGGGGAVSADGTTTDFDNDIVFGGGRFLQLPEGTQR